MIKNIACENLRFYSESDRQIFLFIWKSKVSALVKTILKSSAKLEDFFYMISNSTLGFHSNWNSVLFVKAYT